jgi:outer membrane murein-binding lipoprotein Lpp
MRVIVMAAAVAAAGLAGCESKAQLQQIGALKDQLDAQIARTSVATGERDSARATLDELAAVVGFGAPGGPPEPAVIRAELERVNQMLQPKIDGPLTAQVVITNLERNVEDVRNVFEDLRAARDRLMKQVEQLRIEQTKMQVAADEQLAELDELFAIVGYRHDPAQPPDPSVIRVDMGFIFKRMHVKPEEKPVSLQQLVHALRRENQSVYDTFTHLRKVRDDAHAEIAQLRAHIARLEEGK